MPNDKPVTAPGIVWTDPDSEGYSFLTVDGQYVGYVGIGVRPGALMNYLEAVDTDGFRTVEEAKEDLLSKYRKLIA